MSPHPTQKRLRWLLAAWEVFLMLWFQVMCLFVIRLMLKHPEMFGVDAAKALAQGPLLAQVVREVLFKNGAGVLVFMLGISLGFGAASVNSNEAITSQIFRWLVVGVATLVCVALMPVHDQLPMIGGGDAAADSIVWTLILCASGLLAAAWGIKQARRCA
jgi:hypothetical protein